MPPSPEMPPVLASIAGLAGSADAWISDIWGVLHNGLEAYPAASEACVRFREAGGTVVLVTNAPRPADDVARMLARLGVPREAWDALITSGDVSRAMIDARPPVPLHHLGPKHMAGTIAGLEHRLVPVGEAELVLCTALHDDETETPEDYRETLSDLAARNVPLICANPDIMVERGPRLVPCAGALAAIYTELGGPVHYAGKPHAPIYERAFAAIREARGQLPSKDRILAIGDGLRTDIEGARRAGLRAVFIASALHMADGESLDDGIVARLFAGDPEPPVAAMQGLAW